jgi:flagellar biosynthesis/type III secretory pathway ATPase
VLDQAIALYPQFEHFLQQDLTQPANFNSSVHHLHMLFGATAQPIDTDK